MWLYVPNLSTSSPYAPEEPASISASSWQFQALERSAWWRGKPSQSRHWFQRWNKVSFIRLLCGLMPEPSMAAHGVAQLTASLAASRANLTALPDESREATTPATFGPRLAASSSSRARGSSSSKTLAACSRRGLTKSLARSEYSETFQSLVSRLREDCSRRQKSARAISASGSSSSQWPTAVVTDSFGARNRTSGRSNPNSKHHDGVTLNDAIVMWEASARPTPTANDWKGSGPTLERKDGQMRGDRLDYATEQLWSTPTQVHRKSEKAMKPFAEGGQSSPPGLEQQAETLMWSTPSVADVQGGRKSRSGDRDNELLMNGQADQLCSHLDLTISTVGEAHSQPRRSLNPLFVAWLMGWPPAWTLVAWTDFACSATELSLFKQRMRSALLSLGLPREAPPAQLALFG